MTHTHTAHWEHPELKHMLELITWDLIWSGGATDWTSRSALLISADNTAASTEPLIIPLQTQTHTLTHRDTQHTHLDTCSHMYTRWQIHKDWMWKHLNKAKPKKVLGRKWEIAGWDQAALKANSIWHDVDFYMKNNLVHFLNYKNVFKGRNVKVCFFLCSHQVKWQFAARQETASYFGESLYWNCSAANWG